MWDDVDVERVIKSGIYAEEMSRAELLDFLVAWRQARGGSVSPSNNEKNLETWKIADLRRRVRQVLEQERGDQQQKSA